MCGKRVGVDGVRDIVLSGRGGGGGGGDIRAHVVSILFSAGQTAGWCGGGIIAWNG